ncbi:MULTISPECIES: lipopolysaccharide core heptose(II) kinase RfaY [unclassified Providencia]|uniref:lipopolysaccharide core heptose(II) kinase RfaY n=1 Tax=unclassified Providencia TaxID=2633465 RepID=UPI0023494DCC|nr:MULTISPECIES: lipopolysaccharide core heptose(II) kinase RfaY [unclassified Providencia]
MQKIIKKQRGDFITYQKAGEIDFWQVMTDYIDGRIVGKDLGSGNAERSVECIQLNGQNYIIKCEKERDKRIEKRVMRMLSGPFYSRLLMRLVSAQNQGCTVTNDIYFVAEKMQCRESVETWIIAEYVEGTVLSELDDLTPYYAEMKSVIDQLHRYGLSSNDIHAGNFVLTENGLKVIDLSDYGNLTICKANDLIALKRFYGIEPDKKNGAYRFIRFRDNFRHWSRKLRGKKTRL